MASGSQHEPVYPPKEGYGDEGVVGIERISGASNPDDEATDLSRIAARYPQLLAPVESGDVVFFGDHVLHRNKRNFSEDRFRRAFVGHYCNARSFTQWGAGHDDPDDPHAAPTVDAATGMTNTSHILAGGDTHPPFAKPAFGTPCAALLSEEERRRKSMFAAAIMGDMGVMPANPKVDH